MYRVRRNRNRWRRRWPWRKFFPLRIDDRYCKECGLTYQEGPMPNPDAMFRSNSVEVQKFPAGSFRKQESVFRIGRVRAAGKQLRFSDYIPEDELNDLLKALLQARGPRKRSQGRQGRYARQAG